MQVTLDSLVEKIAHEVHGLQSDSHDDWYKDIVSITLEHAAKHIEELFLHGTGDHAAASLRAIVKTRESK